jgi:hypothetical protein
MKLSALVLILSATVPSVLACVHSFGSITADPFDINSGIGAELWDNGSQVCGDPFRIDQDGHYSASCIPGYVFALSKNGVHAWYGYGNNAFQWNQDVKIDHLDCYGACDDRRGACVKCTQYSWDIKQYC